MEDEALLRRSASFSSPFGKEAAQIFWLGRATIAGGKAQGADEKFAAKPTPPKTDF